MKTKPKKDQRPYEVVNTADTEQPGVRCWFKQTAQDVAKMRNDREPGKPWKVTKIGRDIERPKGSGHQAGGGRP